MHMGQNQADIDLLGHEQCSKAAGCTRKSIPQIGDSCGSPAKVHMQQGSKGVHKTLQGDTHNNCIWQNLFLTIGSNFLPQQSKTMYNTGARRLAEKCNQPLTCARLADKGSFKFVCDQHSAGHAQPKGYM